MASITHDHGTERSLRTVRRIFGTAIAFAVIAATAGLAMVVVGPADGSTLEAVFGITAAVAGLSVGLFAVIATIYASVKDLWRFAPTWIRVLFWAVIVVGLIRTVLSWFGQV